MISSFLVIVMRSSVLPDHRVYNPFYELQRIVDKATILFSSSTVLFISTILFLSFLNFLYYFLLVYVNLFIFDLLIWGFIDSWKTLKSPGILFFPKVVKESSGNFEIFQSTIVNDNFFAGSIHWLLMNRNNSQRKVGKFLSWNMAATLFVRSVLCV